MKKWAHMQMITLALSIHRPEMVPFMAREMKQHDAIFLEEPPAANFIQMLRGSIPIDDYLMPLDNEYPQFSRDMCNLLRRLHRNGKKIYQVEPFIEALVSIHEFFADGHAPGELIRDSLLYPVYLAERDATGALLTYYQASTNESFDRTIEAVIRFARMDAKRFRLRDSLRAQALAPRVQRYRSSYIEAGQIHYPLWRLLNRQLSEAPKIRTVFLADAALKKIKGSGHLYGPGDRLTLLYLFHPNLTDTKMEKLLAARSLVYSKILQKEEISGDISQLPHLNDELACIQTVNQLSLDDCRKLFPLIRRTDSHAARQTVVQHLKENK